MFDPAKLDTMFGCTPSEVAWVATKRVYLLVFLFKQPPRFLCEGCLVHQDGDRIRVQLCTHHIQEVLA